MAFNLGDVFVTFKAKTDSFEKGVNTVKSSFDDAEKKVQGFSTKSSVLIGAVAGVVQNVFSRAVDVIGDSVTDAIKRVDTLKNANRTFENMGFAANDTKAAMNDLKKSILGLPTPLDKAVSSMQLIASSTNDIGRSQKIFSALNNAILGFGGSSEMVSNAVAQMSQDFSNGRISGQTWLSMMNSGLGPALNAIAKQMGITTGALQDGLSDGSISVATFQDALISMNEKGGGGLKSFQKIAKDATSGIGTGFENMKTAITRGLANIIQAVGPENISNAITTIGKLFETGLGFVASFVSGAIGIIRGAFRFVGENETLIRNLAIVITALLLPAIVKIGIESAISFGIYLANLAASIAATTVGAIRMAASWLLALGPIGIIAAAVIALTALIIANWDTVKGWLAAFWGWLRDVASGTWNGIRDVFSGVINSIKGIWNSLVDSFKGGVNAIKGFFSGVGDAITAPFRAAFNAVSGLWNRSIGKLNIKIPSWVPGLGGKNFEMPSLPNLALGTESWRGGIVGRMNEFGSETAILPRGTRVVTADQTRRNEQAGGNTYHINLQGVMARSESELADIMESALQTLDRRLMGAGKPQILGGRS